VLQRRPDGSIGVVMSVYCGRGKGGKIPKPPEYGWLGNPIKLNERCQVCGNTHREPGSTLDCYEEYLQEKLTDPVWKRAFEETCNGQELKCFCRDMAKCHTSVMAKYLSSPG